MNKFWLGLVFCAAFMHGQWAIAAVELRANHPGTYTVKTGDTLWDISEMYLKTPWLWPEIWQANPQVDNPHLIYPGDILSLIYLDGKPRLVVNRGSVKLTPQMRT
ncbi:LysM peptidoglycan-binding domain-containing protein, partial [Pseudomonadales bacterium]|nr:LysM peptidoglycan-binding domain-containing protein [Pseudomonadales bacterium]